ncbi:MAG TPA: LysM peptidoglycan-binding domain-containing protein [Candidatus Dormibacteraeota bacterium]|nr:LysM peptidoglycan-binding domain-containing protein [Candidatus Dormibacteraeota bacterium]
MYALQSHHRGDRDAGPWRPTGTLAWRARWALLALAAAGLLGFGYAREAVGSPLLAGSVPAAAETVTVAPGDTLWGIARARYPDEDTRQKVFEIEQLNGLRGPTIMAGQRLRVPAR